MPVDGNAQIQKIDYQRWCIYSTRDRWGTGRPSLDVPGLPGGASHSSKLANNFRIKCLREKITF